MKSYENFCLLPSENFVKYLETGAIEGYQVWHECYLLLENARFTAFAASELLKEN